MKKFNTRYLRLGAAGLLAAALAACGGGGGGEGGGSTATSRHTIGGAVSGLIGSVVLQNNGGDNLTVTTNGSFTFAGKLDNNRTYAVTVLTQPVGQTCSVSTGTGTVSGNNVSNVAVTCSTNAYTVGGTVSGLTGSVVLQNNSGGDLTVSANGNFSFATAVAYGSPYAVTVLTQPSGQSCSIANGTGTIPAANVSNVAITCSASTHVVGGTVSGLNGSVVLQNNGIDNYTVSVNGPFNFPTAVAYGNPYNVSVYSKPAAQHCSVSSGSGTVTGAIGNVGIACLNNQMGGSLQAHPLASSSMAGTFAGTVSTFLDGTGAASRFQRPYASVSDGANLYVADQSNNAVRKIVIATGAVTTLAGSPAGTAGATDGTGTAATFNWPAGITIDSTKSKLYVADYSNHKIRQIVIATGAVSSVTGVANTASTPGAADGAGAAAKFNSPVDITTDGTNLYVADQGNKKIRQIVIATGVVSSVTGTANTAAAAGAADGAGTTATFKSLSGITTDGANLYVADQGNNKIRKIVIATGAVNSVTGTANTASTLGAADGAGTAATFNGPAGIVTDGSNLYVADTYNNKIRQIVIATGVVSSLTGAANTASTPGAVDGTSTTAKFYWPYGIATDGTSLYVADTSNNKVRKIAIGTGTVSSLAGNAGGDGSGAAVSFTVPGGVTSDGTNLYVTDTGNHTIRKIEIATGMTTTLAGQVRVAGATDGIGTAATFNAPSGITTDGVNLYVADTGNNVIRKIEIATGVVSSLTGAANAAGAAGVVDGAGATATFNSPSGITTDDVNLYVADTGNNKIRKIVIATGAVSSVTGTVNMTGAMGAADGAGATATFNSPFGITTDGINLYVADTGNSKIRKIEIATGTVSSVTGTASTTGAMGATDGAGTTAQLFWPRGITTDGTNLYVADTGNQKIRKIEIANGVVSSVTGTANTSSVQGSADGAAATATFNSSAGITTDGVSLYVADTFNNTIRKIQ